jgi:hypothetical protein
MEYCCVGVIFLLATVFAVLGLVFMLQYRTRTKNTPSSDDTETPDKPLD